MCRLPFLDYFIKLARKHLEFILKNKIVGCVAATFWFVVILYTETQACIYLYINICKELFKYRFLFAISLGVFNSLLLVYCYIYIEQKTELISKCRHQRHAFQVWHNGLMSAIL